MKDHLPLDDQRRHWQAAYLRDPGKFGDRPSDAGVRAYQLFAHQGARSLLELGCGPGRDTVFFARQGLQVTATDYASNAMDALATRSTENTSGRIERLLHDVRFPLPFEDRSFDACYSHMLLCMALTTKQIEGILAEIWRVLRPGGL